MTQAQITEGIQLATEFYDKQSMREKEADEAIDQRWEATRLAPENAVAHYHFGNTLRRQGNYEEAVVHFYEAIKLDPDYFKAHVNLGIALSLAGKPEEAITHYREAIKLKPNFAIPYYNLGNALGVQGNLRRPGTLRVGDVQEMYPEDRISYSPNRAWIFRVVVVHRCALVLH